MKDAEVQAGLNNLGFDYATALPKMSDNNGIEVYPNPCDVTLNIKFENNDISGNKEITLYNLQGEVVYHQNLVSNKVTTEINVSSLNKGLYLLSIKTTSNNFRQSIIIK